MDQMKFAKGHSKVLMKNEQASALDVAREKVTHHARSVLQDLQDQQYFVVVVLPIRESHCIGICLLHASVYAM